MIKPRLRLYVCASAVAVTLGGAVLTQAAGPGEFISRLWNRDPAPKKEVTSGFSPFSWIRRDKAEASARRIRVSDHGRHVVSERPSLASDPFLNDHRPIGTPQTDGTRQPSRDSNRIIVRPEPRQKQATTQSVDRRPHASGRGYYQQADGAARSRIADATPDQTSSRAAQVAQSLQDVQTATANQTQKRPSPGNGQFVNGFENDFQKLFKEVIEESRQSKTSTATPRLPEDAVADFAPPGAARLPEVATTQTDELRKDFAEFAQERSGADVDSLIRESRSQLESSVLARQADRDVGATNVAGASHSNPNLTAPELGTTSRSEVSDNGSDVTPQRLPDRVPQNVNQLIVPNSIVPEGRLFTTSENWMNRGELERQAAVENASDPDLQPVIRVVPGDRGAGVVIESSQWSPIQPRVSSNVAPVRSVPDTSQFRHLSFEGGEASVENGTVLAIGDGVQHQSEPSTNIPHGGQHSAHSAFMVPAMTEHARTDHAATDPPAMTIGREAGEDMAMIIPDSRSGKSLDAAELGAALAAAPAPPKTSPSVFTWPDESEVAAESPDGGFSWGATFFFLALTGGAIGLFFRRKAQSGVFVTTGTDRESEIS
jgi:hypothetical protein